MSAYIHGCLFCMGAYYPEFTVTPPLNNDILHKVKGQCYELTKQQLELIQIRAENPDKFFSF